jgi:hypothetical protein
MTEYYNVKENQELHKIREPYLGQIVAAMYLNDNKWYDEIRNCITKVCMLIHNYFSFHRYRAEVVSIEPHRGTELYLDVYFLDYGDKQFVGKKDILELRADFLSLRFQAIECFLAHVQPTSTGSRFEEWDSASIDAFESLVQVAKWKRMISKVVTCKERKSFPTQRTNQRESSPVPGVELYEENSDKNVALELVRMGHAEISDRFGDLAKSAVLVVSESDEKESTPVNEVPNEPKKEVTFKMEDEIIEPKEISAEPEETTPQPEEEPVPSNEVEEHAVSIKDGKVDKEDEVVITPIPQTTPETIEREDTNNNLDPATISNGKPKPPPADVVFGDMKPAKPGKKKKNSTADFLKNEQDSSSKRTRQDWNSMMDE